MWCARWATDAEGTRTEMLDFGLVPDDHQFGLRDGELHIKVNLSVTAADTL